MCARELQGPHMTNTRKFWYIAEWSGEVAMLGILHSIYCPKKLQKHCYLVLSRLSLRELEHTTQTLPTVEKIEGLVDVSKLHVVGNVFIHLDLLLTRYGTDQLNQTSMDWVHILAHAEHLIHRIWKHVDEKSQITSHNKLDTTSSEKITFFKYFSTSSGTWERLLNPPNAVPFQTRPVTSWNGRVEISCPAAATPMMTDVPHPCTHNQETSV